MYFSGSVKPYVLTVEACPSLELFSLCLYATAIEKVEVRGCVITKAAVRDGRVLRMRFVKSFGLLNTFWPFFLIIQQNCQFQTYPVQIRKTEKKKERETFFLEKEPAFPGHKCKLM